MVEWVGVAWQNKPVVGSEHVRSHDPALSKSNRLFASVVQVHMHQGTRELKSPQSAHNDLLIYKRSIYSLLPIYIFPSTRRQ